MSAVTAEPELGTIVITIPDTVDQLLERIDEESAEWVLVLRGRGLWSKKSELVRLPFRAPVPAPGTSIIRRVAWCADRRALVVGAYVICPTPEWGNVEITGDLEQLLLPGDTYALTMTLTDWNRP
jgi:hypothetical protein